jgi:hypothetical protein
MWNLEGLPAPSGDSWFRSQYGERASANAHRFGLVSRFLDRYREDLAAAGLVAEGRGLVVREEFVRHLLGYPVTATREEIPRAALTEFLDSWSHRW